MAWTALSVGAFEPRQEKARRKDGSELRAFPPSKMTRFFLRVRQLCRIPQRWVQRFRYNKRSEPPGVLKKLFSQRRLVAHAGLPDTLKTSLGRFSSRYGNPQTVPGLSDRNMGSGGLVGKRRSFVCH